MSPIFLFVWNLLFTLFPQTPNPTYLVTQVIDGDTFVVDDLFYVRLTNLDAPDKDFCLYQEATDFLTNLVLNKRVRITSDTPSADGRVLGQAYLDDSYINQEIVSAGMAVYVSGSYPDFEIIKEISAKNKQNKVGVYSEPCLQTVNPDNPKCNIKGNYNVKEDTYTYFLPGCRSYNTTEMRPKVTPGDKSDRWFCTESEALKAGFVKSKNCP